MGTAAKPIPTDTTGADAQGVPNVPRILSPDEFEQARMLSPTELAKAKLAALAEELGSEMPAVEFVARPFSEIAEVVKPGRYNEK